MIEWNIIKNLQSIVIYKVYLQSIYLQSILVIHKYRAYVRANVCSDNSILLINYTLVTIMNYMLIWWDMSIEEYVVYESLMTNYF